MPNIMEISGLLSGRLGRHGLMDLRNALGKPGKAGKRKRGKRVRAKVSHKAMRALPGPGAERALEIAEKMFAEGKKPLAIAWARQAEKKAAAEGKSAIRHRATEMIKMVRGEAAAKLMAGMGDVDGIVLGRMLGMW